MDIGFVAPGLRILGELKTGAIALPVFADERPLQGPAGLIDWRLAGLLTENLLDGTMTGRRGERMLVAGRPRVETERVLLFGAGRREDFDGEVFEAVIEDMLRTLAKTRIRSSAISLPGRVQELISPEDALVRFVRRSQERSSHDEVLLIEPADIQRTMEPLLRREQARHRARRSELP